MRRIGAGIVWAAALALLPGVAWAGDPDAETSLTFRPFRSVQEMASLCGGEVEGTLDFEQRVKGYTPPKGEERTLFFRLQSEWMQRSLVGAVAWSEKGKEGMDFWIDWNGDRKFADEERLKGTKSGEILAFGPYPCAAKEGESPRKFCLLWSGYGPQMVPTGLYEGEVALGDRRVKVGVIDRDMSGVCGDVALEEGDGDVLLVDFDGDDKYTGVPEEARMALDQEAFPMARRAQMPDNAFYRVTVAEDGGRLSLERDAAPLGRIALPASKFLLALAGEEGALRVRGADGEVAVPSGRYRVKSLLVGEKESYGGYWSVPIDFRSARVPRLRVAADRTTELRCGPPFQLALEMGQYRGQYSFSLSMQDRAGNDVDDVRMPNGQRPPEPTLKIVDAAGKTIRTEKFHYG
jgi:hypothetical protein